MPEATPSDRTRVAAVLAFHLLAAVAQGVEAGLADLVGEIDQVDLGDRLAIVLGDLRSVIVPGALVTGG